MPRPPRFFITPDQVEGDRIRIADEDVRHIASVLRMKAGDEILLSDGRGSEYTAKIAHISLTKIEAEVFGRSTREVRLPRIILGQGLPKSDKMDWIVQKATELGVSTVVPLVTERTVVRVKDGEKRLARWRKIAREASMQSSRADLPTIDGFVSLKEYIGGLQAGSGALLLLPWEEGTEGLKQVLRRHPGPQDIVVLIGPEGGFSQNEAGIARERGFLPLSLGRNILRTETAAVAALSMIVYEYS